MFTTRFGLDVKVSDMVKMGIQSGLTYKNGHSSNSRVNKTFSTIPLGDVYDENGDYRNAGCGKFD